MQFLRETKRVQDHDLDLFWAVDAGDTELLNSSIASGANLKVTDREILDRYASELEEFRAQRSADN